MEARIFCPQHGKLELDDVVIKNGVPICRKCMSALEFGKIRPRPVEMKPVEKRKSKIIKVKSKTKKR